MGKKREVRSPSSASRPVASAAERQRQIARRAYELYVTRGYRQGYDLDDWLEAERDVEQAA
jgi:hypothetical protein